MKTKLTLLIVLLIGLISFGQSTPDFGKNELKLNTAYLLAGILDFNYERNLNEDNSFGISIAFDLEESTQFQTMVIPYYRIFFSNKDAAGFFFEVNTAFLSGESYTWTSEGNKFGFGVGIAVGGKFTTKNNWVFECFAGLGRNFVNTDYIDVIYPRLGINFGKRF